MYNFLRNLRIVLVVIASVFFVLATVTNRKYIEGDVVLFYILIPLILINLFIFFVSVIVDRRVKNKNLKKILMVVIIFIQFVLSYFLFKPINW